MAAIVTETKTPGTNTDENATRLNPIDQTAIDAALKALQAGDRGPYDALTPSQKAQVADLMIGSAGQPQAAPPPTTTTSGYPNSGVPSVLPTTTQQGTSLQAMTAQQQVDYVLANAPQQTQAVKVIRDHGKNTTFRYYTPTTAQTGAFETSSSGAVPTLADLDAYDGEYASRLNDADFRSWMTRMATVLWGMDPTKDADLLDKGFSLWQYAGKMVGANPSLRDSVKPEEWLETQYRLTGGDQLYEKYLALAKKNAQEPPPITTETSTQTYSITAAQAQGIADDMSRQLLGRMASDAELKKARGAMQKLLTATVTKTTTDRTDPYNVKVSSSTQAGVGPQDAAAILEMRMRRGSEGMAFSAGKMFEEALLKMGR